MSGGTACTLSAPAALPDFPGKYPENCPWCASKGQTQALRSYRINLHDSVTLCPSPQCLFPLVSRPLEDVLAECRSISAQKRTGTPCSPERGPATPAKRGRVGTPVGTPDRCRPCSVDLSDSSVPQEILQQGFTTIPSPGLVSGSAERAEEPGAELGSEGHEDLDSPSNGRQQEEDKLVPAPCHLFWRNEQNLCWLDTLLVALVHCQPLRDHVGQLPNERSPVRHVLESYRQACELVKASQREEESDVPKLPERLMQQVQMDLDNLRQSTFKLLQPKLQCRLGQKETPVFALPLLLRLDAAAEELFQYSFEWVFNCSACNHTFTNGCDKTLATFTQVFPDWHPLKARHRAQCSRCHHKQQSRQMVLHRVPPVFVLHFVEGMPHSQLSRYSFDFQGRHYQIRTVIQYNQKGKHFVTWVQTDQGSWLEFDDLKHPLSIPHKELPIPPNQIHVVFWESRPGRSEVRPNTSFLDEVDIVGALTDAGASSCPDASMGDATLLDTFEGLTHNDIVTLTLVEVKPDDQGRAVGKDTPTKATVPACATPPSPPSPQALAPHTFSTAKNTRWSSLLSRHPLLHPAPTSQIRSPALMTPLKVTDGEALSVKAAEMFGGFGAREAKKLSPPRAGDFKLPPFAKQSLSVANGNLSTTDALRLRLLKKLKAKKKKLAALNRMLERGMGEATPAPDSTGFGSPSTVSSSTSVYGSPAYHNGLTDLPSPATTTTTTGSHLSPDSTSLLEMLAGGAAGKAVPVVGHAPELAPPTSVGDFLEEFMSNASMQPSESVDLNGFDLFF